MATRILRALLAIAFVFAGAGHFLKPETYLRMMPPYIPFHLEMIYLSGVIEIILGILVLPRKTRRLAGWGMIALLIAVFPANIHIALHPEAFPPVPGWMLWVRLPFQLLFGLWVWKAAGLSERH